MKKTLNLLLLLLLMASSVTAQRYITKNGYIRFFSSTPVEDIKAHNRQVQAALNSETGEVVFKVLMKSFSFKKALMQEHFNEKFVESDKYPNSTLKGKITNIDEIDFTKNGEYPAKVGGKLTIHGVTNSIKEEGTLTVEGGTVHAQAEFMVTVADYDIKIPSSVRENIAKEVKVTVDCKLKKFKK
ncbi:MAG: YceI family protein [Bacteroidales bacterium]|nr:YceI family protein [Bacteroidales bacterium]MCF8332506.1 YceI family protein [Bacteroidales bacterium]